MATEAHREAAMRLELVQDGEPTTLDLPDGAVSIGGGVRDDLTFEGLPVRLVTLLIEGNRLLMKAIRPLRVGQQLFPAHVARVVLPGETITLPNDVVLRRPDDEASRERRRNKSTDFLARELLSGEGLQLESRAATLTCVAGEDEGTVYPIAFLETSVGRAEDADIRLHDRSVSRHHARLIRRGGAHVIEDRSTTNGLFVNGLRLASARALSNGDVIELGRTLLRFQAGEQAPDEHPPLEPNAAATKAPDAQREALEAPAPAPVALPIPNDGWGPRERLDVAIIVIGVLLVLTGLLAALLFSTGFCQT